MPSEQELYQQYLKETGQVKPRDEDLYQQYLKETGQNKDEPTEESLGRRITRGALDTVLPVGGAIAGGLLATPETAGLGTVAGGAAGYAGGKQLSRILKQYLLDDDVGATDLSGIASQTAQDLGEGALMETGGLLVGKGLEAAAPLLKSAGKSLGGYAEKQGAKAIGAGAREFENLTQTKALGRNAIDEGLIGPFKSAEDSALLAQRAKESAGKSMDEVYSAVDEGLGPSISPLETASKVENKLAPEYRTAINKSEVGQLENTIESILARGDKDITLSEAQKLKGEIDSVGYPKGKKPLDPSPKQQMAQDASRIIREEIDSAAEKGAEKIGNDGLLDKLSDARKSYGLNKQSQKLLTKSSGKEEAGIGNKINWTLDAPKFAASVMKKYGPNTQASKALITDKISKGLINSPELVGLIKENPAAFRAAVYSIGKQDSKKKNK